MYSLNYVQTTQKVHGKKSLKKFRLCEVLQADFLRLTEVVS